MAGIGSGIIVGMFPGLGTGVLLTMIFPLLFELDLVTLFLYYFSVMASTQYYGSIVAIVFGIPGEVSSVPAVRHGHKLFKTHQYQRTLCDTATGSLIASLISLSLFWILGYFFLDFFRYFLKGWVITSLLTITMIMMIITSQQRVLALVLTLIGLLVGKIGLSVVLDVRFLTFSWPQLDSGLPLFPLLCGLIVIPLLIEFSRNITALDSVDQRHIAFNERYKSLLRFTQWGAAIRGSVVGFFMGLVPGSGYLISSAVADNIEGKISRGHRDGIMRQLVSAESANNAGAISSLIPLTILGVPIIISEAIVLGVAESKGFNFNTSMMFFQNNMYLLMVTLATVSVVNWLLAGLFFNVILQIYRRIYRQVYWVLIMVCCVAMVVFASQVLILELSLLVFFLSLIPGMLIRDVQAKFGLIVAYIVSPMYIDELYRLFLI